MPTRRICTAGICTASSGCGTLPSAIRFSYFRKYATLSEEEAISFAEGLWSRINLTNLRDNIVPTRQRASLILRKGPSHRIESVSLRRL